MHPYSHVDTTTVYHLEDASASETSFESNTKRNSTTKDPQLFYVCIGKNGYIIAEASITGGNISYCMQSILDNHEHLGNSQRYLKSAEMSCGYLVERMSFQYDQKYTVHVSICDPFYIDGTPVDHVNPLCFMTVAETSVTLVQVYGLLQDAIRQVDTSYSDNKGLVLRGSYRSCNSTLKPKLTELLEVWNSQSDSPDVSAIKNEIQQVKGVMMSNIESLIERSDKIETLIHKTELLEKDSKVLQSSAHHIERNEWWQRNKWYWYGISFISLLVLWVLWPIVGVVFRGLRG